MTDEEAREVLKQIRKKKCVSECDYNCKLYESETFCLEEKALDMAIKALEQQPSKDCVSRESVLMELGKYLCGVSFDEKGIDEVIKELPSVTPQQARWIPVSERLPEKYETVWLTSIWHEVEKAMYIGDGLFDIIINNLQKEEVIAWMPLSLPQPYAESEDAE